MANLPDDWDCYWRTCPAGHRYHASENGCQACADIEAEGDGAMCSYCGSVAVMHEGEVCALCWKEQRAEIEYQRRKGQEGKR